MTTLTLSLLNQFNACQEGIKFVTNNKLLGFPLSRLDEVSGGYNSFVSWLRGQLRSIREYDANNNLVHFKNSSGHEYWREYDANNNLVHFKNSNGYERWNEYDSNNNLIHFKDSNGIEEWNEYDANNNLVHFKDSNGYEEWNMIEYYQDGQLKRFNGLVVPWFEK